jgi:hypothetical protein
MILYEQMEVSCVALHASVKIDFIREVSEVPQAPRPPQMNVEGGKAVLSDPLV